MAVGYGIWTKFGPGGNFKEPIFKSLNARDIALEGNVETLN